MAITTPNASAEPQPGLIPTLKQFTETLQQPLQERNGARYRINPRSVSSIAGPQQSNTNMSGADQM